MQKFNIVLYNGFETLDAAGPAEMIGKLPNQFELVYVSLLGGMIISSQKLRIETISFSELEHGVLLIPGGMGTRTLVDDREFITALRQLCMKADTVLSVCTGSALLAKAGLLTGKRATSNKLSFDWVCAQCPEALWQKRARWTREGSLYTSSGVSAGMDMTLGFIADTLGQNEADRVCRETEYVWNKDSENDPFAVV